MLVLVFRNRILWLFLGWEGLGVSSFVLIIFYQNWLRVNGGLLTLLTNRLGDGVLMISIIYCVMYCGSFGWFRAVRVRMFVLLAFTKRAQWPFIR